MAGMFAPGRIIVSVFSDESWWGELQFVSSRAEETRRFQYSLTNLGGVNSRSVSY